MVTPARDLDAAFERACELLEDVRARYGDDRVRVAKERIVDYRHFWVVPWHVAGERLAGSGPVVVPKDGRAAWISSSATPVGRQIRERSGAGAGLDDDEPEVPPSRPVATAAEAAYRARLLVESLPGSPGAVGEDAAVRDRDWCWLVTTGLGSGDDRAIAVSKDGEHLWMLDPHTDPDQQLRAAAELLGSAPD